MVDGLRRGWATAGAVLSRAMPSREALIVTVVAGLAFGLGLALGRTTVPPASPRDFVTIERISVNKQGTRPSGQSPGNDAKAGTGDFRGAGEDKAGTAPEAPVGRDGEPPAAGGESAPDVASGEGAGVVGPVPAVATDAGTRASSPSQPSSDTPMLSPRQATTPRPASPQAVRPPGDEKMLMPVQGRIISEFGWRKHPVFADWRYHTGIDIGVADGTPVKAALSGKVLEVGTDRELGLYVLIEHRGDTCTKYGHLGSSSVSPGDQVAQGQSIARTGSSGVTSGSYLHFEVIRAGKAQDPRDFL
ncbi:MAG: peptidoglycan DD-metalloendopeptidase family protein [Bacillota bacterium]